MSVDRAAELEGLIRAVLACSRSQRDAKIGRREPSQWYSLYMRVDLLERLLDAVGDPTPPEVNPRPRPKTRVKRERKPRPVLWPKQQSAEGGE
jgi:hypothetical protein